MIEVFGRKTKCSFLFKYNLDPRVTVKRLTRILTASPHLLLFTYMIKTSNLPASLVDLSGLKAFLLISRYRLNSSIIFWV